MREHIGPYRISRALGRGGMGVVYQGVHHNLNRDVAIKALAPELTQDPEFRERFFSEARTQAQLHHPNIVTIYDLLEDQGEFFIVMELVEGRGLDELLHELGGRGMETTEALRIFDQVLAALQCAHEAGVIHRDVKASNVLLTRQGTVKLMDFGIALLVGNVRLTQSAQTIGTPVYMSPEQILRPKQVDHRTDIYSAGVLLYEMLSGRPPFDAETEFEIKKLHIEAEAPDIERFEPKVSPAISGALRIALAKDPALRFRCAADFAKALGSATTGGSGGGSLGTNHLLTPPPVPPLLTGAAGNGATERGVGRSKSMLPWWVGGAAATLLVAVVALVLTVGPAADPQAEKNPGGTPSLAERAARQTPLPSSPSGGDTPVTEPVQAPRREPEKPRSEPPRTDEPAAVPVRPPPPQPPSRDVQAEIQVKSIERLREQVRSGIAETRSLMADSQLEAARSTVRSLLQRSARYSGELEDEVVELNVLHEEIVSAILEQKINSERRSAERARWEGRLQEIRSLIDERRYPEAKQLAKGIVDDSSVPDDLRQTAQNLIAEAEEGLKSIFSKTEWGKSESTIQKKDRKKKDDGGGGR